MANNLLVQPYVKSNKTSGICMLSDLFIVSAHVYPHALQEFLGLVGSQHLFFTTSLLSGSERLSWFGRFALSETLHVSHYLTRGTFRSAQAFIIP